MDAVAVIHGQGTPEHAWQTCDWLWQRECTALDSLLGGAGRVLVVAPHPDDELLACGGLMRLASDAGCRIQVVAVTDGEACYPDETWWTPSRLRQARRRELRAAVDALGLTAAGIVHLGIADGEVSADTSRLADMLAELTMPGDLVLVPWLHDGHPDHEAAARAGLEAAARRGVRCLQYPVWGWHWLSPGQVAASWVAPQLLDIRAVRGAKQQAIACFRTQTGAVERLAAAPILPPHVLERFNRSVEVYLT